MIICSAVRVEIERNDKAVTAVVPGIRHADCWSLLATLGFPMARQEAAEGLLSHKGEFLDRPDAYDHTCMCGHLSATTLESKAERREYALYSEDIL